MIKLPPYAAASLLTLSLCATAAQAQSRVFVAAQGSDANPCSFAAPCRSFQRAHDTVAAGGEIDVLDPAGYGSVIITKAISIQGHGFGGIAVTGGSTGITINAGTSDAINLRGLIIEGGGAGQSGVVFNAGGSLALGDCIVRGLTNGIMFQPTASSRLAVSTTLVANIVFSAISVAPTGTAITVTATFDRVAMLNNGGSGIALIGQMSTGSIKATVTDSVASKNGNTGFFALSSPSGASADLMVVRSVAVHNAVGLYALQPGATVRVSQSTVTANVDAWVAGSGGVLQSYGDNNIDGNTNAVSETAPPLIGKK